MARRIRYIPEGSLVEITCRTLHGRFLFKPSRGFREIFIGVVARAQERFPVKIHFLVCLSGHFHLLVSPEDARQLAGFMAYTNCNLSKEAGRLHGWRGKIIERRYSAILVSDEPAAQIDRLRYAMAHSVKEDLVSEVNEWPGPHGGHALAEGHPMLGVWYDRTKKWVARQRGRTLEPDESATHYRLELAPLPCWAHLPEKAWRGYVREMIADIESEAAKRRKRDGKKVLGRDAVLMQHPHYRPKKIKWSPAPYIHAASKNARWEIYRAYSAFVTAYYEAKDKLVSGDLSACFPEGCFPPPLPFLRIPAPT